ncbi:MAG: ATP-binding protein [Clostridia bacterium]|nr:ATP-binding protein [Clostridia bacterium]
MSRDIKRHLAQLYGGSEGPFFMVHNDNIIYMNESAATLFDDNPFAVLDFENVKAIKECSDHHSFSQVIYGDNYDGKVLIVDGCICVLLHKENEVDKFKNEVDFKAKSIYAIAVYQKQIFDDTYMILSGSDNGKPFETAYRRLIKTNTTIAELTRYIRGKSDKVICCNVSGLIVNAVRNAANLLPTLKIKCDEEIPGDIAYCDPGATENAIYSVISAFMFTRRDGEVSVKLNRSNNMVLIECECEGLHWQEEQIDYVYKRRADSLVSDVHVFGYDMLRCVNLIECQNGEVLVKSDKSSTTVILVLPDKKTQSQDLLMQSAQDKYLTENEASVALSDVL